MEDNSLLQDIVFKREVDPCTQICRCCLSTDKQMKNVLDFRNCFEELAGITVSESDGLPQWLCGECCALITKAARIRWKILKAHGLLYEYSARCAPFPIDAQDVELSRYGSPNLSRTPTLILDFTASKMGFSKVVQHEKINEGAFLELDLPAMEEPQEVVKEEGGFSDYEDNITLEEYRSTVNKSPQHDSAEAFDQAEIEEDTVKGSGNKKRKVKKSEKKPRKKKKNGEEDASEETPTKSYIRKTIEIDPAKIRIVTLNPEEQIKQREEEPSTSTSYDVPTKVSIDEQSSTPVYLYEHPITTSAHQEDDDLQSSKKPQQVVYSSTIIKNKKSACLFCDQVEKKVGKRRTYVVFPKSQATVDTIKLIAKKFNDSKILEKLEDHKSIAYHSNCLLCYQMSWKKKNEERPVFVPKYWHKSGEMHKLAFNAISQIINEEIVEKNGVMYLTDVLSKYKALLIKFGDGQVSADDLKDYRAEALENKILNAFGDQLKIELSMGDGRKNVIYKYDMDTSRLAGEIAKLESINRFKN